MSVVVSGLKEGSLCATHGVMPGDILVSVNGHEIRDALDYGFYSAERAVTLVFRRGTRDYVLPFHKGEYEDLGLAFATFLGDCHKGCRNKCIFCFIDQLPKGLRKSLYFKDDDERLSYLLGNYITLTNLSEAEALRICEMKLSPMNISVHTMNPELRVRMMKNPSAGEVLRYIDLFDRAGIRMNFQIVACPGWNDGAELEDTLKKLLAYENVSSVAVVPVGLTGHRQGLAQLQPFDRESAAAVIDVCDRFAEESVRRCGQRLVAPADEFYLLAGRELPACAYYEDFPQLENGVGMLTLFRSQFDEAFAETEPHDGFRPARYLIITGCAAYDVIAALVGRCNEKFGTRHEVRAAQNRLFGGGVTVTGLLCGADVATCAGDMTGYDGLLLCETMLRRDEEIFLDDMTVQQLRQRLNTPVAIVDNDGGRLLEALLKEEL